MPTDPVPPVDPPLIEARGIEKHYGRVVALNGVDIALHRGEVVGLVGDNGAGKSTLLKILAGAISPSAGTLSVAGEEVELRSPLEARTRGIETIYQDLALASDLSVADNVFLGREVVRRGPLGWLGWLNEKEMARETRSALERLGIRIDGRSGSRASGSSAICGALSGGQRQAVAIARTIAWSPRVLLMDEPTAALGIEEQDKVAELIRKVHADEIPVLLISHNLPQVHELCNRVVVLRRGRVVANLRREEATVEEMVMWITGAAEHIAATNGAPV